MKRALIVSIGLILTLISLVQASQIEVQGNVSGTWSADTVYVMDSICIPNNDTLIINPGVCILFNGHYKFVIFENAVLRAIGTENDYISFNELFPGNGWHSIRFIGASDSSRVEYCIIKHGWAKGSGDDTYGGGIYIKGCSPTISHCIIDSCQSTSGGGGIHCTDSANPIIRENTISNNTGGSSGGVYCNLNSSPSIIGNTIAYNMVTSYDYGAGGIGCYSNSSPLIDSNTITNNSIYYYNNTGGIICVHGSNPHISNNVISFNDDNGVSTVWYSINSEPSSPTIINNSITDNSGRGIYLMKSSALISNNRIAANVDGGIYCAGDSSVISNNTIMYNGNFDFGVNGGGIYCASSSRTSITENLIAFNKARFGGGLYLNLSTLDSSLRNTICHNSATDTGGGIVCNSSDINVDNSIIYYNSALYSSEIHLTNGSSANINCSDVQGGFLGENNIDQVPIFCDTVNYGLAQSSPCAPANNSCGELMGAMEVTCDNPNDLIELAEVECPAFELLQNHPNPFNPYTIISYVLPHSQYVCIEIYNLLGQEVRRLVDGKQCLGSHQLIWDGKDNGGNPVASGIYFYRLESGAFEKTRKMTLIR